MPVKHMEIPLLLRDLEKLKSSVVSIFFIDHDFDEDAVMNLCKYKHFENIFFGRDKIPVDILQRHVFTLPKLEVYDDGANVLILQ